MRLFICQSSASSSGSHVRRLQSAATRVALSRHKCTFSPPARGGPMIKRLSTALALLCVFSLAATGVAHAQKFSVQKFDIKGEGGTDYVAVEAATGRVFVS